MKKQVLLFSVVVALVVQSCQKQEEKVSLSNLKFTPPSEEKEILERIGTFKKDHEKFKEGKLNRVEEEYSVEESVWIIEATANYDFADMSEPLDSFFVDSLVISLPISSYTSNGEPVVNYSDMVMTYENLYSSTDSIIHSQRIGLMGLLMVDVESQKEREGYVDMLVKVVRGAVRLPLSLTAEEFQPTECYMGYGPFAAPLLNNAGEKIEDKLHIRYHIGAQPNSFYTNIQTSDPITTNYIYWIVAPCPGYPGDYKYWGTPDIDGLWQSGNPTVNLCYTELTNYKNKIRDFIDYKLDTDPFRDVVSGLDIDAIDIQTDPGYVANGCNYVRRYSHAFQFKTAKLVHFLSYPN